MRSPRQVPLIDRAYRDLPTDDGTPRYIPFEADSEEVAELTLRTLHLSAWSRNRVGRAVYAHCVNGSRWIIGFSIGGDVPPWWDRLEAKRGR